MQKVLDFLKKTGTYYLATVDGDQPRVRPFGTINIYEGKLYLQCGKKKKVYDQIIANPKVELSAFDGETWIRVAAVLVEDNNPDAQENLLDAYPHLRAKYKTGDGSSSIFYFKDAVATFYTFTGEPVEVRF